MNPSPKYNLNLADLKTILHNLEIVVAGVVLTYLTAVIGQTNFNVDMAGQMMNLTPIIVMVWAGIYHAAKLWLAGQSVSTPDVPQTPDPVAPVDPQATA